MHAPLVATLLLAGSAASAGCMSTTAGGDASNPTQEPAPFMGSDAELLAALVAPVVPDAARCVTDLEAFTALAPRRYENQFQHGAAKDWLEQEFRAAGLTVSRQDFTGTSQVPGQAPVAGQNILGVLPGREANRTLVFGAHYDSAVSAYGAAYDDGSGTLIVVELARALAKYNFTHTLVFAAWDQEEAGLVGSGYYVQDALDRGEQVDLNINFDMAGINWPAKFLGAVDVDVQALFGGEGDAPYGAAWNAVVAHLGDPPESSTVTTGGASGPSDHGSFLDGGYRAVWVHGAVIGNYPMYHNADTVDAMIADVGGDRAMLVAGFDTVLERTFLFTFLADRLP